MAGPPLSGGKDALLWLVTVSGMPGLKGPFVHQTCSSLSTSQNAVFAHK